MTFHTLKRGCAFASALIVISIGLTGCAQIRQLTYPDSFTWIDGDDVRSTMHTMANRIGNVQQLIANESELGENRQQVLEELYSLEMTAQSLAASRNEVNEDGVDVSTSNHLLIDDHLDEFTESVLLAQLQVQSTPPNYYRAGKLIGSCTACHRLR